MSLKVRLKALEKSQPAKPWFTIEVNGEPTADEWALLMSAHSDGRIILVFEMRYNTLGCWMPGEGQMAWPGQ
jgi:hypothetical protein